ncbi:unnamed protein product (macronuclear) [Paramecium tetraurelia]|uniref:Smr domain-containing protein n=1 Tax=Paramecium tetraurelia TaxID=5888 RepID=A0DV14_PARTE|nr:uncharacterized protein GSPATT00020543001 [Paramecium tetraurelia]CAK86881.1 unnamed protein product [Paramecium tetraurelia]|eukprot:XP_001454278.1 hypothetical protein (macronuclear) [Paramecium tetraurelia strain d4-2]
MIALFLGLHFTLLRFLFHWTLYAIYFTLCSIFELKLSILEYLIPIIFEVIYLSVCTTLSLKWYLISQLFNLLWYLISIPFMIISHIYTFLESLIPQQSATPQLTPWQYAIAFFIVLVIVMYQKYQFENRDSNENENTPYYQWKQANYRYQFNNFLNYYFAQQRNQSYKTTRSYSSKQPRSYSQNIRQQSQKINRSIQEEERKKKLTLELNENRETMVLLQEKKANLYQLKKNKEINKAEFKYALEVYVQRIEFLQESGKELFLKLINPQDGLCRVDFHNFYKAEIKGLLDGLIEKIRVYKYEEDLRQVKLKIIVGKGNHSKNGIPVIGPLTQDYLKEYLYEDVEIRNGVIEVQV